MQRFNHILGVIDHDADVSHLLTRAIGLAASNQAALTLIDVLEPVAAPHGDAVAKQRQEAQVSQRRQQLDDAVAQQSNRLPVQVEIRIGKSFIEVIRLVKERRCDLVLKAPEDPAWFSGLFGSEDLHLLRKCPVPVWMVKASSENGFKRVLAAVDVSPFYPDDELATRHALNRQVLELAGSVAMAEFAELHVVCAWQAVGETAAQSVFVGQDHGDLADEVESERLRHASAMRELVGEAREGLGDEAWRQLDPRTELIKGSASREIPRHAARLAADLIVMGTVARTGLPGLFIGNTAENILYQVDCSVLAVKPAGFVSPVR